MLSKEHKRVENIGSKNSQISCQDNLYAILKLKILGSFKNTNSNDLKNQSFSVGAMVKFRSLLVC